MLDSVIDLSHWQRVSDWSAVRAAGIVGVFLKATQGVGFVDPMFVSRASAAQQAGLLVGAYHFMDGSDPIRQVRLFLSVAGHLPKLALDIERNAAGGGTVSIEQAAEAVSEISAVANKMPMVYIGRYGPDGTGAGLPNSILQRCDLWLPEYGASPMLPDGWTDWRLWQYTATGSVSGISGNVDRSRWNGDEAALRAWWGVMSDIAERGDHA